MILIFIVHSPQKVEMISLPIAALSFGIIYPLYTASLKLPNNQVSDQTVFKEIDMMIMVKKKSVTSTEANWKTMWMSKIMKTFRNKDTNLKSYDQNSQYHDSYENSKTNMFHPKYYFPYGIIARKGILMQLK